MKVITQLDSIDGVWVPVYSKEMTEEIEKLSNDMVKDFYRRYYSDLTPPYVSLGDNMTDTVLGVFTPSNIRINIKQAYLCMVYKKLDVLSDILLHEVAHHIAYCKSSEFGDGDELFEKILLRHGISSSVDTDISKVYRRDQNTSKHIEIMFLVQDTKTTNETYARQVFYETGDVQTVINLVEEAIEGLKYF